MAVVTNRVYPQSKVEKINHRLVSASAQDTVRWAVDAFGDRLSLASSFGAEDMVLVDILARTTASPHIFALDTGRLHQETYDVMAIARARYGIDFEVHFPRTQDVEALVRTKGPNSFYDGIEDRKECCRIRKIEPLARALSTVDAWITGLRSSQSVTRSDMQRVETDEAHGGILKINPLIGWSEDDVWAYIKKNGVPYNSLHTQGFPSIGCVPCTRAVEPGEDLRAGRWWWESPETRECGLHRG